MKNFRNTWKNTAIIIACFVATLFASCDREDIPDNPDGPDVPVVVELQNASVSGTVLDIDGKPIQGVAVTSGTLSASTGADGTFTFNQVGVVNSRSVIRFEKNGYFPVVRSGVKKDEINMEVVLHSKGDSDIGLRESFNASEAATLEVAGMEVAIPAGALVKADGSAYSGNVSAEMLYLEPNNDNFEALMPGGDLAAVREDNSEVQLISYGMVDVLLTDNSGNPLQLSKNAESEMTFPIPSGMENNPPASIPLWYFNEETGLWVEEGIATRQGNVYVGKVKHFSWHNLDWPESRIEIKGKVTDCTGKPLDRVKITLKETNGVSHTAVYSDSKGEYSLLAPANTPLTLLVKSADYGNYSPEVSHNIPGKPGGSVVTQDIELPCMNYISGTLANTCGTVIAAKIWLEYTENGQSKKTEPQIVSSADGKFRYRIPAVTGPATLYAESFAGERVSKSINLTGEEQTVSLQLCMELTGLVITASDERGKGFSLAIPNEGFTIHIGAKPSSFPRHDVDIYLGGKYSGENYSENYLVNLGWYGYEPGKTKYVSEPEGMWAYSGVWINEGTDSYAGDYVIDAYSVEFEILSRKGFTFRISVKADGRYWIPGGGFSGEFPVHIEGIIDAQLEEYNYSWLDVASHADFITAAKEDMKYWEGYLHKPDEDYGETWPPYRDPAPVFDVEQVPALPVPYDEAFSSAGEGTDEFFNLCWKNATRATFDDIIQRFKNAGFNVDNVRESTIGYPSRPYFSTTGTKGDAYFEIGFDPDGGKLLPEYETNYGRPWNDENGFKVLVKLRKSLY
jgi:hypothetical protein